jgi:surface antigen
MQLGDAAQWAYNADAHGLSTGSDPEVGATAVFQADVQGASGLGHAAHVEAVYGDGWFLVSEMEFYWNGGGWGRVSYRYAHTSAGVSFIY